MQRLEVNVTLEDTKYHAKGLLTTWQPKICFGINDLFRIFKASETDLLTVYQDVRFLRTSRHFRFDLYFGKKKDL